MKQPDGLTIPLSDTVPIDFMKSIKKKDSINPAAGRSHAPGKSYKPLERFLPKLHNELKRVCQDWSLSKLRKKKVPWADLSTATHPASTPSSSHVSEKEKKKSAQKTRAAKRQRERKKLEEELNKYKVLDALRGCTIEDENGIPLIVLVTDIFQNKKTLNVCTLSFYETATRAHLFRPNTGTTDQISGEIHEGH